MWSPPTFAEERKLLKQGYRLIAGVDEVGRGSLAGPVMAAAVILRLPLKGAWRHQVRDSKELTPAQRESLSPQIQGQALAAAIGMLSAEMVDGLGIVEATRRAMAQAIAKLAVSPQFLLIDAVKLPPRHWSGPQRAIIYGDKLSLSIACASIVAKVARDRLMVEMAQVYPGYGFAQHKGYGTPEHLACLARLGPCPIHRRSFAPVREIAELPSLSL